MPLRTVVLVLWGAVGVYWLVAAVGAKRATGHRRGVPPGLVLVVAVVLLRALHTNTLVVHSPVLRAFGVALVVAGLGLAVWARIFLGRNWGMPMTQKQEPQLVTAGPYRLVRHPIYSGLLLAGLGTALATNLYWLIAWGVMGVYFIYAARTEERWMLTSFPSAYPSYRAKTKMLVPFIL